MESVVMSTAEPQYILIDCIIIQCLIYCLCNTLCNRGAVDCTILYTGKLSTLNNNFCQCIREDIRFDTVKHNTCYCVLCLAAARLPAHPPYETGSGQIM